MELTVNDRGRFALPPRRGFLSSRANFTDPKRSPTDEPLWLPSNAKRPLLPSINLIWRGCRGTQPSHDRGFGGLPPRFGLANLRYEVSRAEVDVSRAEVETPSKKVEASHFGLGAWRRTLRATLCCLRREFTLIWLQACLLRSLWFFVLVALFCFRAAYVYL